MIFFTIICDNYLRFIIEPLLLIQVTDRVPVSFKPTPLARPGILYFHKVIWKADSPYGHICHELLNNGLATRCLYGWRMYKYTLLLPKYINYTIPTYMNKRCFNINLIWEFLYDLSWFILRVECKPMNLPSINVKKF